MRRIFASRIRDMSIALEVVGWLVNPSILAYDPNHAGLQALMTSIKIHVSLKSKFNPLELLQVKQS